LSFDAPVAKKLEVISPPGYACCIKVDAGDFERPFCEDPRKETIR
jgi:hypothetical protein